MYNGAASEALESARACAQAMALGLAGIRSVTASRLAVHEMASTEHLRTQPSPMERISVGAASTAPSLRVAQLAKELARSCLIGARRPRYWQAWPIDPPLYAVRRSGGAPQATRSRHTG